MTTPAPGLTYEEAIALLTEARREAATYRTRLREAERQLALTREGLWNLIRYRSEIEIIAPPKTSN